MSRGSRWKWLRRWKERREFGLFFRSCGVYAVDQ